MKAKYNRSSLSYRVKMFTFRFSWKMLGNVISDFLVCGMLMFFLFVILPLMFG